MHLHARDRRKWFGVNFGTHHFAPAPAVSAPLALAFAVPGVIALAFTIALLGALWPDAGTLLAISPGIAIAREKAARAIADATKIRDELKATTGAWPADKQEQFNRFMTEFTEAKTEVDRLETHDRSMTALDAAAAEYLRPADLTQRINHPAAGSESIVRESFAAYRDKGPKAVRAICLARGANADDVVSRCAEVHREAFRAYLAGDVQGLMQYASRQQHVPAHEIHALLSNDQSLGGFTVPDDFQAEVIKAESGFAVMRPLVRVQNTMRDTLVFPKVKPHSSDNRYSSGFAGQWQQQGYVTGGTAPTVQNQPTFQQERIPVHNWQPDAVEISTDLLEDSAASVEQILAEVIGETKAIDEDDVILSGTGVGRPEGVTVAGITTVNSGSATDVTFNGLVNLYFGLPIQYRRKATWLLNSQTMGNIVKLNTGTGGVYIFPPNTMPENLFQRPYAFHEGMTAPSAGVFTAADKAIIFGDFKRYILAERQALRIMRLNERFAPNVGFLPTSRIGGQVVLTQAFRIQVIGA